jgi:hypothetical protein
MRPYTRVLLVAALLVLPASSLRAQTAADPSGHWEGAIHVTNPNDGSPVELSMDVDLAKIGNGAFEGAITIAQQGVKGRPLTNVAVVGQAITFQIMPSAPGDNTFKGALSADGKTISGDLVHSGASLPFSLTRTGSARIEPPARSTAIGKELEGTWNGTLTVGEKQLRIVLTLANQPDGTATGRMVSLDQATLEIPIATITQEASSLTLDVKAVSGSYSGTVNPPGTELVGTWTQDPLVLPLTFTRAATEGKK